MYKVRTGSHGSPFPSKSFFSLGIHIRFCQCIGAIPFTKFQPSSDESSDLSGVGPNVCSLRCF